MKSISSSEDYSDRSSDTSTSPPFTSRISPRNVAMTQNSNNAVSLPDQVSASPTFAQRVSRSSSSESDQRTPSPTTDIDSVKVTEADKQVLIKGLIEGFNAALESNTNTANVTHSFSVDISTLPDPLAYNKLFDHLMVVRSQAGFVPEKTNDKDAPNTTDVIDLGRGTSSKKMTIKLVNADKEKLTALRDSLASSLDTSLNTSFEDHKKNLFEEFYKGLEGVIAKGKEGQPVSGTWTQGIQSIPKYMYNQLFETMKAARNAIGLFPTTTPAEWGRNTPPVENTGDVMDFNRDTAGQMTVTIKNATWDKIKIDYSLQTKTEELLKQKRQAQVEKQASMASLRVSPAVVAQDIPSRALTEVETEFCSTLGQCLTEHLTQVKLVKGASKPHINIQIPVPKDERLEFSAALTKACASFPKYKGMLSVSASANDTSKLTIKVRPQKESDAKALYSKEFATQLVESFTKELLSKQATVERYEKEKPAGEPPLVTSTAKRPAVGQYSGDILAREAEKIAQTGSPSKEKELF